LWAEDELQTLESVAEEAAKLTLCPRQALRKLAELNSQSEKLVFLFLCLSQPQTFTGIRRSLNMSKVTLSRTLKKLQEKGLITVRDCLYWVDFHGLNLKG